MEVMAKFGLIGNPISHSKSPSLFAAAYGGKCGSYELIEADSCVSAMERFIDGEYRGINVTAPYKEQVLEYVTDPDRASCELGNVNLLLKDENHACNGRIYSYNTDYYGVKNTVKELLSGEYMTDAVVLPEIKRVTVVGAGGAGKAAALAMADSGYKVCLVNRSPERAVAFANKIGAEYVRLEDLAKAVEPVLQDLSRRINGVLRSMDAVRYAADKGNVSGVIDGLDLIANSFLDARDIKVNNGFINSFIDNLRNYE